MEQNTVNEFGLPGFRFHPTEEELLNFYLRRTCMGKTHRSDVIGFLNIYLHDPSELPGLAKIGEREWYFFVHRDRKQGHGGRPNRTTESGFWKATGSDRSIRSLGEPKKVLGLKKTLVFYRGRAPRGTKTDWVMNEYRLPDHYPLPKEDIVLCKIYRKAMSLKILEQRAALEDQVKTNCSMFPSPPSQGTPEDNYAESTVQTNSFNLPKTNEEDFDLVFPSSSVESVESGCVKYNLKELEVPSFAMDLAWDPLWTQWKTISIEQWSPYANILNF